MNVNRTLMELMRSEWLISFEGLRAFAPIAHQIISGQKIVFEKNTSALVTIIDENGKRVQSDKNDKLIIPKSSVAIVDMVGPVMKYSDWCNYGADEIVAALKSAESNPNIIGTILNVDSPGGAVSAIGPFIQFGKDKKKPVISVVDQCASLGFWAACAISDYKIADNNISASIGSVGVVSTFTDNRKYLESIGYVFHEVYADESEYKNLAYKLALEGEYKMIKKEILSPLAIKFQEAVRAACPNLKEEVGVLTGKTFGADDAVKYGMIDAVGSLDQAINRLHIMSESKHYTNY